MTLEPEGNGEICSVTGKEANAKFQNGIGYAWYGSRYDMSHFVDVSGRYDGPVSDDVLERAVADGEIFVFGWSSGGGVPPEKLPAAAFARIFVSRAIRQAASISSPPEGTPVRIGMISHMDASELGAPRWLASLSRFGGTRGDFGDPDYSRALWALSTLARGGGVDTASAEAAGLEMHAFVVAARAESDEFETGMVEAVRSTETDEAPGP